MNKKLKTVFTVILSVLIVATLAFIWGQSFLGKEKSSKESSTVYETVEPVIEATVGTDVVTEPVFRKIAHFTEFMLLGVELNLLFLTLIGFKVKSVLSSLSLGFTTAFLDETIQIFSKRGPMIKDVWIDFFGVLSATVIYCAVIFIVIAVKTLKKSKNNM